MWDWEGGITDIREMVGGGYGDGLGRRILGGAHGLPSSKKGQEARGFPYFSFILPHPYQPSGIKEKRGRREGRKKERHCKEGKRKKERERDENSLKRLSVLSALSSRGKEREREKEEKGQKGKGKRERGQPDHTSYLGFREKGGRERRGGGGGAKKRRGEEKHLSFI